MRTKRLVALAAVLGVAGMSVLAGAGPATASTVLSGSSGTGVKPVVPSGHFVIRTADATGYPNVQLVAYADGATVAADQVAAKQNGKAVEGLQVHGLDGLSIPVGTVFVVDTSKAMNNASAIDRLKAALHDAVKAMKPWDQIAIVAFGVRARTVASFTSDTSTLDAAIDTLSASPDRDEAAFRDALHIAVGLWDRGQTMQHNIVVVSASADGTSSLKEGEAVGDVVGSGALLLALGIQNTGLGSGYLRTLASASGGTYNEVSDAATLADAVSHVQQVLESQLVVTFSGPAQTSVVDIELDGPGGLTATGTINAGAIAEGTAVRPHIIAPDHVSGPSFLNDTRGKVIGGALALVACILLAYGLGLLLIRDGNALDTVLRPYNEGFVGGDAEADESDGSRIETKLVRRAVAFTSQFAQRQGLQPRIEKALEAADLPLRAAEALFFYVALGLVVSVATLLFTRSPIKTLIVVAIIVFLPPVSLQFLAKRRRKLFLSQLPDTLQLLAGSLRAGYSLMQGVEAVSQEVSDPMGRELRRVMIESRLGRPLEDALEDAAARMGSPDFAWAVMAIRIQREVGGNLAELLMTVAETMVSRERLRRDVKALTAEGRVSAIVLGVLPVGLGLAMYMINKKYMQVLFHDRLGNFMLGGSILMMVVGFWWMKKTVEVDV